MRRISDTSRDSLHGFIKEAIEPGCTVRTDGLNAYLAMEDYVHDWQIQSRGFTPPFLTWREPVN